MEPPEYAGDPLQTAKTLFGEGFDDDYAYTFGWG